MTLWAVNPGDADERGEVSAYRSPHNGSWTISRVQNGFLVRRTYYDYSKSDAIKEFKLEMREKARRRSNPGKSRVRRKAHGSKGATMARKKKRSSKKRPSAAQLRARAKFAAMARARAKAGRSTTRTKRRPAMARKKKATRRRTGTMRSVKRRGHPVSRASWRASGYRRNRPAKRRRRSSRYRSNPGFSPKGILSGGLDLVKGAGVAMAGAAAGKFVTRMIPFGDPTNPLLNFAKGAGVAIGIRVLGEKVLGRDMARFAAVGAMMGPLKELIVSYAPGASAYLGASDAPMYFPRPIHGQIASYSGVGSYAAGELDESAGMGSYSEGAYN